MEVTPIQLQKSTAGPKSAADWIDAIQQHLAQGKTTTLELANVVFAARQELHYGQWTDLWRAGRIPFSKRKAEMLVAIGKNLGSLDAQNIARLPQAWSVLYCLALIAPTSFQKLLTDGAIHPGLTLREAKLLSLQSRGMSTDGTARVNVRKKILSFGGFVRRTLPDWTAEERETACRELATLLATLEATPISPSATPNLSHGPNDPVRLRRFMQDSVSGNLLGGTSSASPEPSATRENWSVVTLVPPMR